MSTPPCPLLQPPLHDLHVSLGARMVPFAGYSMPVQYPAGLVAEHHHTRTAAGLFDVSHMGQVSLSGPEAAMALEDLMPTDIDGLPVGKQRYSMLLNKFGGIIDDLMITRRGGDFLLVVNGACKTGDIDHIQTKIGRFCHITPMPEQALLALQGPLAAAALSRLSPGVERLVFMTGDDFTVQAGDRAIDAFVTRSGYTGEDGFEISVHSSHAVALAQALLAQPEVKPVGLGARNSLRLEAGLPLYGADMDTTTTPVEAGLKWAIHKNRRAGGYRPGGFMGCLRVLDQCEEWQDRPTKMRVGLLALDRVPVREHTLLQDLGGRQIGHVTSGLISPTLNQPIAMGYVPYGFSTPGTRVDAVVRGRLVRMQVVRMPFVPTRYFRGP